MPSYRTKAKPGADAKGKALLGWKITSGAEIAMKKVDKTQALKKIGEIRGGAASTGEGTYRINGIVSYHSKVGSTKHAVAWHFDSTTNPQYVIVEGFLEKNGTGNKYDEL
jgi:hypothetical protein